MPWRSADKELAVEPILNVIDRDTCHPVNVGQRQVHVLPQIYYLQVVIVVTR